jgi:hypothetical protein
MTSLYGSVMPLMLVALGFIAVILSFLVPDRKKANISLVLAGVIILFGFIQLFSQTIQRYQWDRRMKEIQRDRQVDLDELREKLKDRAGTNTAAPAPAAQKKK